MERLYLSSLLSCFLLISLSSVHSSPIEEKLEAPELKGYLETCFALINKYREKHSSPALTLDSGLRTAAEGCAKLYVEEAALHSCPQAKDLSESVAIASGGQISVEDLCPVVVNAWYSEHKKYNFENPNVTDWRNTGDFTYMVWKSSTAGGLGCFKGEETTGCVALYRPKGNKANVPAYKANVLPPKASAQKEEETQLLLNQNININISNE